MAPRYEVTAIKGAGELGFIDGTDTRTVEEVRADMDAACNETARNNGRVVTALAVNQSVLLVSEFPDSPAPKQPHPPVIQDY